METAGDPWAQPAPVLCANEFFEEVSVGEGNLTSPMRLLFTPVVYGSVGKKLLPRTRNFSHRPARVVVRSAVRPVRLSMHALCGLELLEDDVCRKNFQNALSQCNHFRR